MRSGASVTLLAFATLIQCYAARTRDDCTPLSMYATMAELSGASQRVLEI